MILTNGSNQYQVGERVAETETYRIYLCEEVETGRQCLLQIAAEVEHNGGLDRAAYVLGKLKQTSDLFEAKFAETNEGRLSYDYLFPQLVDSFVSGEEQGRRRVNILAFTEVDDVTELVPLSNLATKHGMRVDLKTSAWILGRLLKLAAFAHGQGIAIRALSGGNILLLPERHFAITFDWSSSLTHQGKIPAEIRKDDIASAAKTAFAAIGGDPEIGDYPYDGELDDKDRRYLELVWRYASRRESDAEKAHRQLYDLLEELWGRKFHPFIPLPL